MTSQHSIRPLFIALVASMSFPFAALATNISIGEVSPTSPSSNVPVTLSASVSSPNGIQYCHLYVESEDVGDMTIMGTIASRSYTFTRGGVHTAFVFCRDNSSAAAAGPNTSINVQGPLVNSPPMSGGGSGLSTPPPVYNPAPAPAPSGAPAFGSLVKLVCPTNARADDACKAVYYYGRDGKRHAFSNSKVFFSWYQNFDTVITVSPSILGGMPLGKNVTYRPGTRMVKFTTVNNVFVVSRGGVLRWVKTEALAQSLYGADWNTKVDDISDVFYTNYIFSTDINNVLEYNVASETAAAVDIDSSL